MDAKNTLSHRFCCNRHMVLRSVYHHKKGCCMKDWISRNQLRSICTESLPKRRYNRFSYLFDSARSVYLADPLACMLIEVKIAQFIERALWLSMVTSCSVVRNCCRIVLRRIDLTEFGKFYLHCSIV